MIADPAAASFVLGYHGCDHSVAERVLAGDQGLQPSNNDYDWLGDGIYFWEHNSQRAYEFACELRDSNRSGRQKIKRPAVVGAIIDLGFCLNLLDSRFIRVVKDAHDFLVQMSRVANTPLPTNSLGPHLLLRRLDCAVIRSLHETRLADGEASFDSVRAAFIEGPELYPNSGFAAKNHIQIAVRKPSSIKGYFRPLDNSGKPLAFGG